MPIAVAPGGTSFTTTALEPTLAFSPMVIGPRILAPGATAIGIPARILDTDQAKIRAETAEKMGFSAYAIAQDMNDPVVQAIHAILDHTAANDERMQLIIKALEKLGVDINSMSVNEAKFDVNLLNKIVD